MMKKLILMILFMAVTGIRPGFAQQIKKLTLKTAINLAVRQNRLLKISHDQVRENEFKLKSARSQYFPRLTADGTYSYSTNIPILTVDQGAFGALPGNISLPPANFTVLQGDHLSYTAKATLYQPITQLMKVAIGDHVAKTNLQIQKTKLSQAELKIRLGVEKLYLGILLEQKKKREAKIKLELAKSKLKDAQTALEAGNTLNVSTIGLRADVLDKQQDVLKAQNKIDDYLYNLKQMLGQPSNQNIELKSYNVILDNSLQPISYFISKAKSRNPEIRLAQQTLRKADDGVKASRRNYIPDLGAFAQVQVQKGIPITPRENAIVGVNLKWNLFEFGKKRDLVQQRKLQREEAGLGLAQKRDDITGKVERLYRKVKRAELMIETAQKAVDLRKEEVRIQKNATNAGLKLETILLEAQSKLAKAEVDLLAAELNYKISLSELYIETGTFK